MSTSCQFSGLRKRLAVNLAALVIVSTPLAVADSWVEIRSPNFSVVTDAGSRRGLEVALRFEQMRAVFGTLILRGRVHMPVPVQVIAFRDTRDFRQFVPLWQGKPIAVSGLFQSGDDRSFLAVDLSSNGRWETIFHEYGHFLLNANYPRTQLWFDEGFAGYYSSIRISDKEVQIGAAPEGMLQVLQNSPLMPVLELFRVQPHSKVYNESGDRRSVFYSQAWLLVHYLYDRNTLPETGEYFNLVENQGVSPREALQRAFGMGPEALDEELESYLRAGKLRVNSLEAPPGLDSAGYEVISLDEADIKAVFADLHLHSPDYFEQAVGEFQEVLRLQPDHAGGHRGLGYAFFRKDDFDRAEQHFRRAATLDPSDARVHYLAALLMNREAVVAGREPEDIWQMKTYLERAIALNPDFAEAHNLLATAHMWTGDTDAAISSMKRALQLSPRNEQYSSHLAEHAMASQKWDLAETLLLRLKESSSPEVAEWSRRNLARLEEYRRNPPALPVRRVRPPDDSAYIAPQWKRKGRSTGYVLSDEELDERPEEKPVDLRPVRSLRGKLLRVECPSPAEALLSVVSGSRTWKMRVVDRERLILIGAEEFSCAWRERDVVINYREAGEAEGDLVSLELAQPGIEPVPLPQR